MKTGRLGRIRDFPLHLREREHQAGRFQNMCSIANEISDQKLEGDVIEFGTWRGVGLLMLAHAFTKSSHQSGARTFWGVDTFTGLPRSSTVWKQHLFSDTSENSVLDFLRRESSEKFKLVSGLFEEEAVSSQLRSEIAKCVAIHFDADLGSSTLAALKISEKWVLSGEQPIYFLFDDWGIHPDEVPDAFQEWIESLRRQGIQVVAEKICSTRFTRYYRVSLLGRQR